MPTSPAKKKQRQATLNYVLPGPKVEDFHAAWKIAAVRILCGGYGSGKSFAACADVLLNLLVNPVYRGKKALVVGLTHRHCEKLLLPHFKTLLTTAIDKRGRNIGFKPGIDFRIKLQPLSIELPFGSTIEFLSLDSKENLAGFNASIVYADEIDKTDLTTWNEVQNRAGREGVPGLAIATCNPANKAHWIYQRYWKQYDETGTPEDGVFLKTLTIYDNPHLTAEKKRDYENQYGYSALEKSRALLGEWVSMEGCVFPNFDPSIHTYDDSKPNNQIHSEDRVKAEWARYRGLDFGGVDKTACVWVAKSDDGNYFIYREHYKSLQSPTQNAKDILRPSFPTESIRATHSDTYVETRMTYKEAGLHLTPADKGPGSIEAGCNLIRNLIESGRLKIGRSCKHLIDEMQRYQYDPKTGKPKDRDNHLIDALRYVLWAIEGKGTAVTISKHTYQAAEVKPQEPNLIFMGIGPDGKPQYARLS